MLKFRPHIIYQCICYQENKVFTINMG